MDIGNIFLVVLAGSLLFFGLSEIFGVSGHGDVGGHDHGGGGDHDSAFTSDILTIRNLFLFGVGFGAAGYLAHYLGQGPLASSLCGSLIGVAMALAGTWLFRTIRGEQSNSIVDLETLTGKSARVITAIPATGSGEISTTGTLGAKVHMAAKSQGEAIPEGSIVTIVAVIGTTATVKTV